MFFRSCFHDHVFHVNTVTTTGIPSIKHLQNDIRSFNDFDQLLIRSSLWVVYIKCGNVRKWREQKKSKWVGEFPVPRYKFAIIPCFLANSMDFSRFSPFQQNSRLSIHPPPKVPPFSFEIKRADEDGLWQTQMNAIKKDTRIKFQWSHLRLQSTVNYITYKLPIGTQIRHQNKKFLKGQYQHWCDHISRSRK